MTVSVDGIPIIDTHEHVARVFQWRPETVGLLHLVLENHYLMADVAAAYPETAGHEWMDPGITPYDALVKAKGVLSGAAEKTAREYIIKSLPRVALTSDWKAFQYTLRNLFGLEDYLLTAANWDAVDARVREKYRDRDKWYGEVFARAGISTAFWCYGRPLMDRPFRGVLNLMDFINAPRGEMATADALGAGFSDFLEREIASYNPVSIKVGFAYYRDLAIQPQSTRQVTAALEGLSPDAPLAHSRVVDDYVHGIAARLAAERGIAMQVHTGILAGNIYEQPLVNTYANRIETFISTHPETRFDLFHGSFPQWGEVLSMARKYANVFVNMCWVPGLSESVADSMLASAFDAVPVNKIMWGGDAHSPEMGYGLAVLFREVLTRVINRRGLDDTIARDAAEWVLWRSAAELYKLSA